jgi:hypothetical protein
LRVVNPFNADRSTPTPPRTPIPSSQGAALAATEGATPGGTRYVKTPYNEFAPKPPANSTQSNTLTTAPILPGAAGMSDRTGPLTPLKPYPIQSDAKPSQVAGITATSAMPSTIAVNPSQLKLSPEPLATPPTAPTTPLVKTEPIPAAPKTNAFPVELLSAQGTYAPGSVRVAQTQTSAAPAASMPSSPTPSAPAPQVPPLNPSDPSNPAATPNRPSSSGSSIGGGGSFNFGR